MKFLITILTIAGLFSVSTAQGLYEVSAEDFILAIHHFDPDHQKGLKADGPEAGFMTAALRYAREMVPETRFIHQRKLYGPDSGVRRPTVGKSLTIANKEGGPNKPDMVIRIAEKIGEGCLVEVRSHEAPSRSDEDKFMAKTTLFIVGEFGGDRDEEYGCKNQEVAEWLSSNGVLGVLLRESYALSRPGASLSIVFREFVDLHYMANRLREDPKFHSVFGEVSMVPNLGGKSFGSLVHTVELVAVPQYEGFSGVVGRFSYGWSDCAVGCMYRHYWKIYIRSLGKSDNGEWRFMLDKVEESGDYLSFEVREKLCSGAIR